MFRDNPWQEWWIRMCWFVSRIYASSRWWRSRPRGWSRGDTKIGPVRKSRLRITWNVLELKWGLIPCRKMDLNPGPWSAEVLTNAKLSFQRRTRNPLRRSGSQCGETRCDKTAGTIHTIITFIFDDCSADRSTEMESHSNPWKHWWRILQDLDCREEVVRNDFCIAWTLKTSFSTCVLSKATLEGTKLILHCKITNHLHVDVQRHWLGTKRQWRKLSTEFLKCVAAYAARYPKGHWSFLGPGSEEKSSQRSLTNQTVRGTESLKKGWYYSQ